MNILIFSFIFWSIEIKTRKTDAWCSMLHSDVYVFIFKINKFPWWKQIRHWMKWKWQQRQNKSNGAASNGLFDFNIILDANGFTLAIMFEHVKRQPSAMMLMMMKILSFLKTFSYGIDEAITFSSFFLYSKHSDGKSKVIGIDFEHIMCSGHVNTNTNWNRNSNIFVFNFICCQEYWSKHLFGLDEVGLFHWKIQ